MHEHRCGLSRFLFKAARALLSTSTGVAFLGFCFVRVQHWYGFALLHKEDRLSYK